MVAEDRKGAQCEEVKGRDVGTSMSALERVQPNSGPPTTVMRCSGSRNCVCTGFQSRKSSTKCRACSHLQANHESSGDDSSNDSDTDLDDNNDSSCGKLSASTKNKKTVSALLTNLIEGGDYTSKEVEGAKNEAKAGLTRKRVGRFFGLRSTARAHHAATQGPGGKPKAIPKPTSDSEPSETDGQRADGKTAKVLGIIMFPYGKKVSPLQKLFTHVLTNLRLSSLQNFHL